MYIGKDVLQFIEIVGCVICIFLHALVGGYGGPEGWPAMPPGYPPPPGYDYYSGYYCPPYGAYPPGYDYSGYYDYSAYYSQPPADWSSYAAAAAASYAPPYTGMLPRVRCLLCMLEKMLSVH